MLSNSDVLWLIPLPQDKCPDQLLICSFVFVFVKIRFSHDKVHNIKGFFSYYRLLFVNESWVSIQNFFFQAY